VANARPKQCFKVYISGQKRRVTGQIKRELRRRSAMEPGIGHLKSEHHMGRNHLANATGDAINALLAAVGYKFRRLLAWLSLFGVGNPAPPAEIASPVTVAAAG
jgi:IS5 family transposase